MILNKQCQIDHCIRVATTSVHIVYVHLDIVPTVPVIVL